MLRNISRIIILVVVGSGLWGLGSKIVNPTDLSDLSELSDLSKLSFCIHSASPHDVRPKTDWGFATCIWSPRLFSVFSFLSTLQYANIFEL